VLATQNPVDLDYKALSNTGTWMIGRLQTERDRDRLLDGLMSAANPHLDRTQLGKTISGLKKRVFLLHNVHEAEPVLFHSRWALSYLCGPLTRNQIKELQPQTAAPAQPEAIPAAVEEQSTLPPALPPDIAPLFIPVRSFAPRGASLFYRAALWIQAQVHFFDQRKGIDERQTIRLAADLQEGPMTVGWASTRPVEWAPEDMGKQGQSPAEYGHLPAAAAVPKNHTAWRQEAVNHLYRSARLTLFKSSRFDATSQPGESERDFRIRLSQTAREYRDRWSEELRKKYSAKIEALQKKIHTAEQRLAREKDQAQQHKIQSAISIGTTLLGAFLGRKVLSQTSVSKAGTAIRTAGRASKEAGDVKQAEANLEQLQQELEELQKEFQTELEQGEEKFDPLTEPLESFDLRPKKTDIDIKGFGLVWIPFWRQSTGQETPASF
ncbi:ATP-binding protein, partial [candidate division KSB1 bacterium]|nr:ATP-binding protein [candidate division KSB1 bacterium]